MDLNLQPLGYDPSTLPIELQSLKWHAILERVRF